MSKRERWIYASLVLALSAQAVHAQDVNPTAAAPQPDLGKLRQQVAEQAQKLTEQQRQLDESQRHLGALQKQLQELQKQLGIVPTKPAPTEKVAQPTSRWQADEPTTVHPVGQAPSRRGHPPPEIAPLFEQPGVLSPAAASPWSLRCSIHIPHRIGFPSSATPSFPPWSSA
jgi:TolA-binding protein